MIESLNVLKKMEELIKEHGSASILRDHVNLLKEQFSISEKKTTSLEARIAKLEAELQNCEEEKKRLNDIINDLQASQSITKIDEITEKTLKIFFDEAKELDAEQLSSVLSLQHSLVDYHLDVLRQNKLIIQTRVGTQVMGITSPPGFSITPKGREYIIRRYKIGVENRDAPNID